MDEQKLRDLVREDRVSGRVYTDPAVFELEMQRLWGRTWLFGCHEAQIPNVGDFMTTTLARQPIIFTRTPDGEVAALFNRCAHRGSLLCNEMAGNAAVFHCPYHGWAFHSDGRLAGVPYRAAYPPGYLESEDLGLGRVPRVGRYRGFVFISLAEAGLPFDEFIAQLGSGIDNMLDRSPTGELEIGGLHRYSYNGNWKLQIENGVDEYHPLFSHASTVSKDGRQIKRSYGNQGPRFAHGEDEEPLKIGRSYFDNAQIRRFKYGQSCLTVSDRTRLHDMKVPEYRDLLIARHGAVRVDEIEAETHITNAVFYPNLILRVVGNIHLRVVKPIAVDRTEVWVWPLLFKGAPANQTAGIIRYANMHTSSASFVQSDDLEVFERAQAGMMAQAPEWIRLARGFGMEEPGRQSGELVAQGSWEAGMRVQFEHWRNMMTEAGA